MESSAPLVLIISSVDDAHIPFVTEHLQCEHVVLDPNGFSDPAQLLTYDISGGEVRFGDVALRGVSGVWYRKPQPVDLRHQGVDDAYLQYATSAIERHFYEVLANFRDALWISDYWAMVRAERKTLQLDFARKSGFSIPETMITASPAQARNFLRRHRKAIAKPMSIVHPMVAGKARVLLTRSIGDSLVDQLDTIHLAPSILQQEISGQDVRVTVVGDQCFAASVLSDAPEGSDIRDSRLGHYVGSTRTVEFDLPRAVSQHCISLTRSLGLMFGAIDLIVSDSGEFWFLELNPNGQWAYVERDTGLPIGAAIAGLLSTHQL